VFLFFGLGVNFPLPIAIPGLSLRRNVGFARLRDAADPANQGREAHTGENTKESLQQMAQLGSSRKPSEAMVFSGRFNVVVTDVKLFKN
jgi:hypothetical protein